MPYIVGLLLKRQRAGMSQNALASKAGVDRQTVSRCEHGYTIRKDKAFKILNALNSNEYYWSNRIPESEIMDGGKEGKFPLRGKSFGAEASVADQTLDT